MAKNMSETKTAQKLALAFAQLSRSAARKKAYSRKASMKGRPEVASFLRAMSASETVQARRLFNSLIGKIDTSDAYLTTIFEDEMPAILENYAELIASGTDERPALLHALTQLRAAETRLRSFYTPEKSDVKVEKDADYFVCTFCGYLSTNNPPDKCPICGAPKDAFHKIN